MKPLKAMSLDTSLHLATTLGEIIDAHARAPSSILPLTGC